MNFSAKLFTIAILFLIASCKSDPKKIETIDTNSLSKQEMLADFELLQNIFEKANAGLYKYHTKLEIDSVFVANKKLITTNLSYREFYTVLWNVINYTGSCHNELYYPETLENKLHQQHIFFPIPLKYIDNKLYTNYNYKEIAAGTEIVSINNISSESLSSLLAQYTSTDGHNTTGKYTFIETRNLPWYLYLIFGKQQKFDLVYKLKNSSFKTEQISAVDQTSFRNHYKNRFSKQDNKEAYTFNFMDSIATGYLKVSTFGMGGPESEGHKKYAKFLKEVFLQLKEHKTSELIVDIRGNGGGNDPNDILLYSYLTHRNFKENTSAFTLFQDIPFPEYYIDDDIDELPISLKEEHSIFKNGKYYQKDTYNKIWKPNANAFKGKVILLIDPYVASAGSLFASLVKSDENTTVIGEETLGGYYGHTGHTPVNYELPNSKLILNFSIVDLEQDVAELADEDYGDGIQPDYLVIQSYADFMEHKDTQLDFTISYIKKN